MNLKLFTLINNHAVLRKGASVIMPKMKTVEHYAPEIALVSGMAAGVCSGLLFARAYKRHDEIVENIDDEIEATLALFDSEPEDVVQHNTDDTVSIIPGNEFTPKEKLSILAPLYGYRTGMLIRNYAPAAAAGAASVLLILKSHGMMKGRVEGLAAALVLVEQGFQQYRERVAGSIGKEAEENLYFGAQEQKIKRVTVDQETGKKKKSTETGWFFGEKITPETYQREFGPEVGVDWNDNHDWNLTYLKAKEAMANQYLRIHKTMLLNDVYQMMGYPRTNYGAVVGWSALPGSPGDDFVDFGLDRSANTNPSTLIFKLDFNVNGPVVGYIGKE